MDHGAQPWLPSVVLLRSLAYIVARQEPTDKPPDPPEPSGRPTIGCWSAADLLLPDHNNSYYSVSSLYFLFSFNTPFLRLSYPRYLQAATKIYRLQRENATINGGGGGIGEKW